MLIANKLYSLIVLPYVAILLMFGGQVMRRGRVKSSSTGPTMAVLPRSAIKTGKSLSWSRKPQDLMCGSSPSPRCAPRCLSTCGWIPSSGLKRSTPWAMYAGMSSTCSRSRPRAPMWPAGCRASRNSHHARSPVASTSIA